MLLKKQRADLNSPPAPNFGHVSASDLASASVNSDAVRPTNPTPKAMAKSISARSRMRAPEESMALNARVFEMLASASHVSLAESLIGQLNAHKKTCETYLASRKARFPQPAVAAVAELMAQFGTDEVSKLAQELRMPEPGEERWNVDRMIDLIDRVQSSLFALVDPRWGQDYGRPGHN